jgi:hypothetical protein
LGQVGGRLSGLDARFQKNSNLALLDKAYSLICLGNWLGGGVIQRGVHRQAYAPQHQPGRLVKCVVGAMPKGHAGRIELAGALGDQFQQDHSIPQQVVQAGLGSGLGVDAFDDDGGEQAVFAAVFGHAAADHH